MPVSTPEGDLRSAVLVYGARMPDSFMFLLQQVQRSLSDNDRRNSGEKGDQALRRSSKSTDNAVGGSLLRCGPCRLGSKAVCCLPAALTQWHVEGEPPADDGK